MQWLYGFIFIPTSNNFYQQGGDFLYNIDLVGLFVSVFFEDQQDFLNSELRILR